MKHLDEFNDQLADEIREKVEEIAQYFDSIQIFATRHVNEEEGTTRFIYGHGNMFATYGLIKLWDKRQVMETEDDQ